MINNVAEWKVKAGWKLPGTKSEDRWPLAEKITSYKRKHGAHCCRTTECTGLLGGVDAT